MSDFTTVASVDDSEAGTGTVIDTGEATIALFNTDGDFYAIGNECTHQGGPLGDGELDDTTVTCPWHGAEFDVTSGDVLAPPADEDEPTYEVRVDGDEVQVDV